MNNEIIFYTQLVSLVVFILSLFGIYRSLVSNKDSLIELQRERIAALSEEIKELKLQTPDALAESLSIRVERQLSEIERLRLDGEEKGEEQHNSPANIANDIIVKAVVDEIKEWKDEINRKRIHKWSGSANKRKKVTGYLGSKTEKKQLFSKFVEHGGTEEEWMKILSIPVDNELYDKTIGWSITQWREFVFSNIKNKTNKSLK